MNPKLKNLLSILVAFVLVALGGVNLLDTPAEEPAQPVSVTLQQGTQALLEVNEDTTSEAEAPEDLVRAQVTVEESGQYTSKDEVAAYLHQFGHLPSNYITKRKAEDLGWVNSEGNLNKVAPGMSIGGDWFGNYEGQLPAAKGRKYWECDIDFGGRFRNAKRIIYSNDGLIYYTEDHYETFELLYGRE